MDELIGYKRIDRVGHIILNRPAKRNALTQEMLKMLREALERLDDDDQVVAGVIRGSGPSFCSGADVAERHLKAQETNQTLEPEGRGRRTHELVFHFANWKPLIAAVQGSAVGGGLVLALSSDLIVVDETATFQVTEITRGISGNAIWSLLARRCGESFANDAVFTGRTWNAEEALAASMVNRLVSSSTLIDEAHALASSIGNNPPLGVREAVRHRRLDLEMQNVASQMVAPRYLRGTRDFAASAQDFVEKKPAP